MTVSERTAFIKKQALQLGFDYCGISKAVRLEEDAIRLEEWLNKGYHGSMKYMENYFDLRTDPSRLVPGAKSVITVLKNYFPEQQSAENSFKVSKYAFGKDYHEIIRAQLNLMLNEIRENIGEVNGRGFVDSAPVLERAWAKKSGLGWIGKNACLINKQSGSFFFIATLIIDVELEYDDAYAKDFCGSCTRCMDACPTGAIHPDKSIEASKCISYFTIELKEMTLPGEMQNKFKDWIFGCDICQDVCPWNRFSTPHQEEAFTPLKEILNFTKSDWENLNEDAFKTIFKHSPIKRTKFKGLSRNIRFVKQSEL